MKRCPGCGQTYTDGAINFCLNDGELLSYLADDAPRTQFQSDSRGFADDTPTVFMDKPRVTDQSNWQTHSPPARWSNSPENLPPQQFAQYPIAVSPNQTLAVVSLILGIGSLTLGWCCSLGLLLSPAALVTGFIALSQIKKNPQANAGRGLAIGGIVTGAVFLAGYLLLIIIYGIAIIGSGIN